MPKQILIALDQLLNALFGGYADETLSSRAYRQSVKGNDLPRRLIDGLFFWQNKHCYQAYQSERVRSQQPPEFMF
jgi:hypothetical protein